MNPYTTCGECVFAQKNKSKQTGCSLERSSKLGVDEVNKDGSFVLSRFCNTYRPEEWLKDLSLEESQDIKQTVLSEVRPKVGFFVLLDTSRENGVEELKTTLEDIKAQSAPPSYVVTIVNKPEYSHEVFGILEDMFDIRETYYHVVQLEIEIDDPAKTIDEAFTHAKNGLAYVTSSGESVPRDFTDRAHKRVNIDMRRLVVIKPYERMNGLVFQASLFKFVNGNKVKVYQDEQVDTGSFLEKVEKAFSESDDDTLISWSQFNE